MTIARVELDVPLTGPFDYITDSDNIVPGSLVAVSFGRRRLVGVVVELTQHSTVDATKLKRIEAKLPVEPLPSDLLTLAAFCASYYRYPLGRVLAASLPTLLRNPGFGKRVSAWQYSLTESGLTELQSTITVRAKGRARLFQALQKSGSIDSAQARLIFSGAKPVLEEWLAKGWVDKRDAQRRPDRVPGPRPPSPSQPPPLSAEQEKAINDIAATLDRFVPWLLYGVTGSGKTEVYLSLIESVLAAEKQVLLLVPEINLTPQLEARVRSRFPAREQVSLHSGLAEGERLARWNKARSGIARIVLGTRLALFTPLPRLGLLIVDEEHDSSFKQGDGLRYHARDLAVYVARRAKVPVVLGSATPSLETYANVIEERYRKASLLSRPNALPPQVRIIDVRGKKLEQGLSDVALTAISERLRRNEQVLVYINRRGYAPVLLCRACGWTAGCRRCSARLTLHARTGKLKCHYCGHDERVTAACPQCGNIDLHGLGQGTQRVEEGLRRYFPGARILRIDSDSTRKRGAFASMREQIHEEQVDIIVGTQMLAKGHDFPKLTLVVVVGADHSLYSSNFRASEFLFQQLMQVTGRAGRGRLPGEVLVQSEFPEHPVFQALKGQDFDGFAETLLEERRNSGFPPFVYQALLRVEGQRESEMWSFLSDAMHRARAIGERQVMVYDVVPAPMFRVAGRFRGQLLVQSKSRPALRHFLTQWKPHASENKPASVRWTIDVDPIEL